MDTARMELPIFLPGNDRNWVQVDGVAHINEDGTLTVRLKDPESAEAMLDMAKKGILTQLSFDYRMPLDELEKINKQFSKEYHDERTMAKVHEVLEEDLMKFLAEPSSISATDVVMHLQNAGILFRETK